MIESVTVFASGHIEVIKSNGSKFAGHYINLRDQVFKNSNDNTNFEFIQAFPLEPTSISKDDFYRLKSGIYGLSIND
jgi:hypothetical protein